MPIRIFWLSAVLLLISATLVAGEENTTSEAEGTSSTSQVEVDAPISDSVEIPAAVDDAQIQQRLERILGATGWFAQPAVRVDEGVVFLTGRAGEAEHAEWAVRLAENTDGVVAVINQLETQTRDTRKALSVVIGSAQSMWEDFLSHLPLLIAGALVLSATWLVSRLTDMFVRKLMSRTSLRQSLQDLALQLTTIAIWITGIMIASVIVFPGMTPGKILTVLGLGSVAIGFAFKDIFENFFAGILILWRFPFDRGDFISCNGLEGKVEEITIRMTMIRQVDGQLVVVPNATLFKNAVDVLTDWQTRRVTVICGVGYGEDVDRCRDVITEAVESCSTVNRDRDVEVFAKEFGDSSINFEVTWWTGATPLEVRQSRDEVVAAVKRSLDEAGLEIPFPYRTLTFSEPLSIARQRSNGFSEADADRELVKSARQ